MARVKKMATVARGGSRLEQLKNLAAVLAKQIDFCAADDEGYKMVPQLSKQYRDTIREIEQIEGAGDDGDEISKILQERDLDGKSNTVR